MSKKLIAIASAAALALTGLVSAPAFAVGLDVNEDTNTKATAIKVMVPEMNDVYEQTNADSGTAVRFTVTASEDDQKIEFNASEGVKFVIQKDFDDADDAEENVKISAGRTSYVKTIETEGEDVDVWAFNTSTTAGKLVITSGDNRNTYWVAGTVGGAYNMTIKFPSSIPTTGDGAVMTAVVTDVFGNAITEANNNGDTDSGNSAAVNGDLDISVVGAEINGSATDNTWTYSTKKKVWESSNDFDGGDTGLLADDSGAVAIRVDLTSAGADKPDLTEVGFAKAKASAFSSVSAQSLTDTVASLEAKLANTVSKAKYNNLVKKYNKITRGKKAKLVK
jgi:hypothetical protein